MNEDMKRCPFCAEEIKEAAVICRYCKNDLKEYSEEVSRLKTLHDVAIQPVVSDEYKYKYEKAKAMKDVLLTVILTTVFLCIALSIAMSLTPTP